VNVNVNDRRYGCACILSQRQRGTWREDHNECKSRSLKLRWDGRTPEQKW
jgi:hypothetical protein